MTKNLEDDEEFIKARNEVFRKVGRNIYLFQQFEKILKRLNAYSEVSGYASEIIEKQKKKVDETSKLNMGILVGQLFENIYADFVENNIDKVDINEPYISHAYKVKAPPEFVEQRKLALKSLVNERNYLVHHLFIESDMSSVKRFAELEKFLDKQREKVFVEYEQLRQIGNSIVQAARITINNQDLIEEQLLLMQLQQSNVIKAVTDAVVKLARPDGWTLLNHAGQEVAKKIPEMRNDLKRIYGCKSLKAAIVASEMFELLEEETKQGGKRLLFRLKPNDN